MPKHNEDTNVHKISATSPDTRKDMLEKIREIYPALFGEGNSLNAKEMQALVDDYSKPEAERYSFPWAGKTASKRFAFTPSKARLVPDKERSVDFDTTENLIIEGENLEVLKLLQASYFKKVKMIYIDPPYNTGHDFVYPDDYSESKQAYWEKNGVYHDGVRMDTNTESSGRYHSNWLSMMQSRLLLARNLLRDDGVIFISIDDNEVHNLRKLMDEIFGEENFVGQVTWKARVKPVNIGDAKYKPQCEVEYVIIYQKAQGEVKFRPLMTGGVRNYNHEINGRRYRLATILKSNRGSNQRSTMTFDLNGYTPPAGQRWQAGEDVINHLWTTDYIEFVEGTPFRRYFEDEEGAEHDPFYCFMEVDWSSTSEVGKSELNNLLGNDHGFDTVKPVRLLKTLIQSCTTGDDLILDFFAGSGTTAHAIMELNGDEDAKRKFILVQLPEATDEKSGTFKAGYKTISQITIERVKRAGTKTEAVKPEVDTGFRVLRLSKSLFPQNMFEVNPDMSEEQKVKAWEEYLERSKQSHLFDFKPDELLVEIALKDGFDLNFKAESVKAFKKNNVLDVSDGEKTALICLDENIQEDTIKDLEPYKERRFICLERAVDSTRKWNLKRMFGDNLWVA